MVMNRDFVYNRQTPSQPSFWSRASGLLSRWMWAAVCCGLPGIPCYFCTCCEKVDDTTNMRERSRINQATATTERLSRPRRPHTPGSRKSTPEMLSAVRCALNQLQGEPAPQFSNPIVVGSGSPGKRSPEPG